MGLSGVTARSVLWGRLGGVVFVLMLLLSGSNRLRSQQIAAADAVPRSPANSVPAMVTPEVRADVLVARRQYMEAIHVYEAIPSPSAAVLNKLGVAYERMRMYAPAKMMFERAMTADAKLPGPENNLATVLYLEGDLRHAEQHYKRALKVDPRSASVYNNLGTLYFTRQKVHKGVEAYQQALSLDPMIFQKNAQDGLQTEGTRESRALINYYLAQTCAQAGQTAAALQYLHRAAMSGFHDRAKLDGDRHFDAMRPTEEFRAVWAEMKEKPVVVAVAKR